MFPFIVLLKMKERVDSNRFLNQVWRDQEKAKKYLKLKNKIRLLIHE